VPAHPLLRSRCHKLRRLPAAGIPQRGIRQVPAQHHQHRCNYRQRRTPRRGILQPETGTRQRTDAERQRTAETKAAREAALTELNRERQQKCIRDAQELSRCLSTGMGLLTPEQVRQITNTVTGTNNEPMDTLSSFNERLETLIQENPHASSADLKDAAESAVQVLIAGAKNAKERQRKTGPQQALAVFEVPREAFHFPELCIARTSLDPLPAGRCGEQNQRSSRCTTTSVASGPTCTRRSRTATRTSSEATVEL
jgi:hypothetical protein